MERSDVATFTYAHRVQTRDQRGPLGRICSIGTGNTRVGAAAVAARADPSPTRGLRAAGVDQGFGHNLIQTSPVNYTTKTRSDHGSRPRLRHTSDNPGRSPTTVSLCRHLQLRRQSNGQGALFPTTSTGNIIRDLAGPPNRSRSPARLGGQRGEGRAIRKS